LTYADLLQKIPVGYSSYVVFMVAPIIDNDKEMLMIRVICKRLCFVLVIGVMTYGQVVAGQAEKKLLSTGTELAAENSYAENIPENKWSLSAGILYRRFDHVSFNSGMNSSLTAMSGSLSGSGDHEYDDGYVRMDPGTSINGDTWYWGYTDAGQVSGDSIWFHSDLGVEQSSSVDDSVSSGDWSEDGISEPALYIEAERLMYIDESVALGIVLNVMYSSLSVSDEHSTFSASRNVTQYHVTISDRYDLDGMIPPSAPYSGSYDGPGPLLEATPDEHIEHRTPLRSGTEMKNMIREKLDADLWTIGLGMSAVRDAGAFSFSIEGGPSMNVVQTDASYDEWLTGGASGTESTIREWHDSAAETEIVFGMFGQIEISWNFTERLQVGLVGRYDWLETINGTVGPSDYEIDLKGYSGGIALERFF